jgi:hypothetical protein
MTEIQHTTGPARAEFSDDVLESVETVRTAAIEAREARLLAMSGNTQPRHHHLPGASCGLTKSGSAILATPRRLRRRMSS